MKTRKEIVISMLSVAYSFIIIFGSIQSNQAKATIENPTSPFPYGENRSEQVKTKYLYVGAEKCASECHNSEKMGFQFNIWKSSPHKDAYIILVSKKAEKYSKKAHLIENPQESKVCLKCHITGGELDSSYFAATYKKVDGVTCEACHKQKSDGKTYVPDQTGCLLCHNDSVHIIRKFDFRKECAKIAHPRPTELLPKDTTAR